MRRPPAIPRSIISWAIPSQRAKAYGNALLRVGGADLRVVAMDGDTKNSTYSEKFFQKIPGTLH